MTLFLLLLVPTSFMATGELTGRMFFKHRAAPIATLALLLCAAVVMFMGAMFPNNLILGYSIATRDSGANTLAASGVTAHIMLGDGRMRI